MESSFVFADTCHFMARWKRASMPRLGQELTELAARHGLMLVVERYYNEGQEKEMMFRPPMPKEEQDGSIL